MPRAALSSGERCDCLRERRRREANARGPRRPFVAQLVTDMQRARRVDPQPFERAHDSIGHGLVGGGNDCGEELLEA